MEFYISTQKFWKSGTVQIRIDRRLGSSSTISSFINECIITTLVFFSQTVASKHAFNKTECFCFTQQTLQPGQEVRMPVLYYVDPKILDDPDNRDTQQITLSYTFYPVEPDKKAS